MINDNNIKEPCKHEWTDIIASEEPMTNQIRITGTCTKCKKRVTTLVNKEELFKKIEEKTLQRTRRHTEKTKGGNP